jgi:sugar lactone lactonase YvrE
LGLVFGLAFGGNARGQVGFGSQPVGSSAAKTVTVPVRVAGTLGAVEVLTGGVPGADFAAAPSGSTCVAGNFYSAGQTCLVTVSFTPAFPGTRAGAVVLLGASGNVMATAYLNGTGVGALGVLAPGTIRTVAGSGQWTAVGDGLPATSAGLFLPASVVADGAGNLFIADSVHNRIRRVDAATGIITTIAGNGDAGYGGDNQAAVSAALNVPGGVALDGAGNLYIADTGNNVVREVTAATGIIATIAGDGVAGYSGDNGSAASAQLNSPSGVTVDLQGDVVIADTGNHRIRLVNASTGIITTVAGNGTTATNGSGSYSGDGGPATLAGLNFPYAVGFDPAGNMYIPDSGNNRIRMVSASTGEIETVAGGNARGFAGDHGQATSAKLYAPSGVAFDAAGNLYIADTQNNRIREVNAVTGTITTLAGNGTGKFGGDSANGLLAGLYGPYCVFADASGNLYIADYFDNRIREISSTADLLSYTPATEVGSVSAPQSQLVENEGNAALGFAAISADANTAIDAASTTCSVSGELGPALSCAVGVEFAPSEAGSAVAGSVTITETPGNSVLNISATGQALALSSTSTQLSSSANPSLFGQAVQLVATVMGGAGTPTGTVIFTDGGSALSAPVLLDATGSATLMLSPATAVGPHSIIATYGGDASHTASASTLLVQTIDEATSTTIASSLNPSAANGSVTFSAAVTSAGGGVTPTGSVVFQDGAVVLGTATLDSYARASVAVAGLAAGEHSITAAYNGVPSASVLGSISATLNQVVQGQTATVLSSSVDPSLSGQAVQLLAAVTTATGSPAGSVTFTENGRALGGPIALNATGTASYALASAVVGTHSIVAAYSGDASHLASISNVVLQEVEEATTTGIVSSQNPSAPNASIIFSATVAGAAGVVPSGSVVFQDGAAILGTVALNAQGEASLQVSGLAAGVHSITASYSGLASVCILGSASPPLDQAVQGQTTTVVTSSANPSTYGSTAVFTASVSSTGPNAATGTVNFFDGSQPIGSASLLPQGVNSGISAASISTSALTAGLHSITAVFAGSPLSAGSASAPLAQRVEAAATSVAAASSLNPSVVLTPIVLSASVAGSPRPPGGVVVFLDNATPLGTQTLDANGFASLTTTALAVGQHDLSVNYPGDANDSPSTSNHFLQTVQVIPTTTSLSSTGGGANSQLTLSATVAGASGPVPTGSVAFQSGSTTLGTGALNSSGVAVLTLASSAGATSVVAAYPGDPLHGPSASVPFSAPTLAGGFQLMLNPDSVTLPTAQNTTVTLSLGSSAGFADQIGLGCASLPALVTCYFSSDSVALKPNGTVTEQLTIDTDSPLSGGPVAANDHPAFPGIRTAEELLPSALLLGWLLWRKRSRQSLRLWLLLLPVAAVPQMAGCGAITQKSAAPGTYVIQVTATGTTSGITQTVDLTVDVTR